MKEKILIAQITDTHILAKNQDDGRYQAMRPSERLRSVVQSINSLETKPDLVIHTGDITDDGTIESYSYAKEILDQLETRYFLTCGNHDEFTNLKKVFTAHGYFTDPDFAHYVIEDLPLRIIVMDTKVTGQEYGELCQSRKAWLLQVLNASQRETIIFLHHFPITVKDAIFNKINLLNGGELEDILVNYDNVIGLYCGHAHYAGAGIFAKKICWIAPSTAPTHILQGDQCLGFNFCSPCYSLHLYDLTEKKVNSFVTAVN